MVDALGEGKKPHNMHLVNSAMLNMEVEGEIPSWSLEILSKHKESGELVTIF